MRKGDHHEEESSHEENLLQEFTPEVGDPTQQAVLAEEEAEASLPQTTEEVEKRSEMGRGIQSSELSQTQDLLTNPTHAKVSLHAKRVSF